MLRLSIFGTALYSAAKVTSDKTLERQKQQIQTKEQTLMQLHDFYDRRSFTGDDTFRLRSRSQMSTLSSKIVIQQKTLEMHTLFRKQVGFEFVDNVIARQRNA